MRRVGLPWLVVLVVLLATAGVGAAQDPASWVRLGPSGPHPTVFVATAPGWPGDAFALAARWTDAGMHLVRSGDGGATWEQLAAPAERLSALAAAPSADGSRVFFAVQGVGPDTELGRKVFR